MNKQELQEMARTLIADRQSVFSDILALLASQKQALSDYHKDPNEYELMDSEDIMKADIFYLSSILAKYGYSADVNENLQ